MHSFLRTRRWAALFSLALVMAAGCGRRAFLFVDVLGSSEGLTIQELRVTYTNLRHGRSITLNYPPVEGTNRIDLPTSYVTNFSGDIDDGDELDVLVEARGGGAVLLSGTTMTTLDLGDVVNATVTLLPPAGCGNMTIDAGEDCDGSDLGGEDCVSQGWASGALGCAADCSFDTSACAPPPGCGDGAVSGTEECDTLDLGGATCTNIGLGFDGGTLGCQGNCVFDTSGCTIPATCGNGVLDPGEPCDGPDLGGQTCLTVGAFSGGTLACGITCSAFDTSGCDGPPTIPLLRKPMNNSYVGSIFVADSLRPTFVWAASSVPRRGRNQLRLAILDRSDVRPRCRQ